MPYLTITSERQIAWLRQRYPSSVNRFNWRIGWDWDSRGVNSYIYENLAPLADANIPRINKDRLRAEYGMPSELPLP